IFTVLPGTVCCSVSGAGGAPPRPAAGGTGGVPGGGGGVANPYAHGAGGSDAARSPATAARQTIPNSRTVMYLFMTALLEVVLHGELRRSCRHDRRLRSCRRQPRAAGNERLVGHDDSTEVQGVQEIHCDVQPCFAKPQALPEPQIQFVDAIAEQL